MTSLLNYCEASDVLRELNITDTPEALLFSRINENIPIASRLIDDYCATEFYGISRVLNSEYDEFLISGKRLNVFFPVGSIIYVKENDVLLTADTDYVFRNNTFFRLGQNWSCPVEISFLSGYKHFGLCENRSSYLELPSLLQKQCSVFTTYLIGERKVNEKTKTEVESGNRVQGLPKNWSTATIGGGGGGTYVYEGKPATGASVVTPETYVQKSPSDVVMSVGYKVPIEREKTTIESSGIIGLIPSYELQKLDSFKYLRV